MGSLRLSDDTSIYKVGLKGSFEFLLLLRFVQRCCGTGVVQRCRFQEACMVRAMGPAWHREGWSFPVVKVAAEPRCW